MDNQQELIGAFLAGQSTIGTHDGDPALDVKADPATPTNPDVSATPPVETPPAPAEETPPPAAVDPTVTAQAAELEAMKRELFLLRQQLEQQGQAVPPQAQPEAQKPQQIPSFVSQEEAAKIFEEHDIATFNQVLMRAMTVPVQQIAQNLPGIIRGIVKQTTDENSVISQFYAENKDLVPYTPHIGIVAQELARENPHWTRAQLLSETAKTFRARFNLTPPAAPQQEKPRPTGAPTAVGRAGGTPPPTPAPGAQTPEQKQQGFIDQLISYKGR